MSRGVVVAVGEGDEAAASTARKLGLELVNVATEGDARRALAVARGGVAVWWPDRVAGDELGEAIAGWLERHAAESGATGARPAPRALTVRRAMEGNGLRIPLGSTLVATVGDAVTWTARGPVPRSAVRADRLRLTLGTVAPATLEDHLAHVNAATTARALLARAGGARPSWGDLSSGPMLRFVGALAGASGPRREIVSRAALEAYRQPLTAAKLLEADLDAAPPVTPPPRNGRYDGRPAGFVALEQGRVLVRAGCEANWPDWARVAGAILAHDARGDSSSLLDPDDVTTPVVGGRGTTRVVPWANGATAHVRVYRHGGALGDVLGTVYSGGTPRAFRELVATDYAARLGFGVAEPLAAAVLPVVPSLRWTRWLGRVVRREVFVTRSIRDRRELGTALLAEGDPGERVRWLEAAARIVRRLLDAGIVHPDLNCANFLVGARPDDPIALLDFDRARLLHGPAGFVARRLAVRRLSRSVGRLGLPGLDRANVKLRVMPLIAEEARRVRDED